jgi:hypothetical protein
MDLATRTTPGSKSFTQKRPCATHGCITLLNRYHAGKYCYKCEDADAARRLSGRHARIVELARRGYRDDEIAELVDRKPGTVRLIIAELRDQGIDIPFRSHHTEIRELMVESA